MNDMLNNDENYSKIVCDIHVPYDPVR